LPRLLNLLLALHHLLLHLLHLLRGARRPARCDAGRNGRSTRLRLWLLLSVDVFVVGVGRGGIGSLYCTPGVA
jgi:hypothetical protein